MSKKSPVKSKQHATGHALLSQAVELHQAGRYAEAKALYERIIAQAPGQFDATHLLGVIALQEGELDDALRLITSALSINPNDATALNNLGTVHLRSRRAVDALRCFEQAVRVKPNWPVGLENLGTALRDLNRPHEALVPLRRAHTSNPNSIMLCRLLGTCLLDIGDAIAARKMFESGLRLDPENPEMAENLAIALARTGDHEKARDAAAKALAIRPNAPSALATMAAVQIESGQIDAGIESYKKAVALPNASSRMHSALADALLANGLADEAIGHFRTSVELDPQNGTARWKLAMSECQPLYRAASDIPISRRSFSDALKELQHWFQATHPSEAYAIVGSQQPEFLAYQPFNNRELLLAYGQICSEWMKTLPRDRSSSKPVGLGARSGKANRKIRVGIVSSNFHDHSAWARYTHGWIQHLDRSRFEISLLMLTGTVDSRTETARSQVDHFQQGPDSLQGWVQTIGKKQLDVLLYPAIGRDGLITQLASLRLAGLQAAAWGHPETTGLPTIDWYLSAAALEPSDGDDHYTERLVRLPNLGVCIEQRDPAIEDCDLGALRLPANEPLLLCAGTLAQYSPVHDVIWAKIARGLKGKLAGRLVFFSGGSPSMDRIFEQRLRRAFKDEKADFDAKVTFAPRPEPQLLLRLMRQAVLLLDTLGCSDFETALQAVISGLPVLAREGPLMRGRLASSIMRRLGLPELVATTDAAFIDRAIALAGDRAKLLSLSAQIASNRHILYEDLEPIRALERCLIDAVPAT